MDTILRFGAGAELYTFDPSLQISLRDNFRDLVQQSTRLPSLSGGINEHGLKPAPRAVGNVSLTTWLIADETASPDLQAREMQSLKSNIASMSSFGTKRLYKQPMDASLSERYCEASISNISINENASAQPHARIRISINWQVTSPYWLAQGTEAPAWGDGSSWGAGTVWGGSATNYAISGLSNIITVTTAGNAETYPRIVIKCDADQTAENIVIQRLEGNDVKDEIQFNSTLGNNDELIINTRANSVKKNGLSFYNSAFNYLSAGWFKLKPAENKIRILMGNESDAINLQFRYYEAYV